MRIGRRLRGERTAPDYPLLRAALAAAQAATPTARAQAALARPAARAQALAGLLGRLVEDEARRYWLRGSFAPAAVERSSTNVTARFTLPFQPSGSGEGLGRRGRPGSAERHRGQG